MASKSLCLASAGLPARRRETNHSNPHVKGKNRNDNSNRNKNRRQFAPMPSAGGSRKLSESALGGELSDFTLDESKGRSKPRNANHLFAAAQTQPKPPTTKDKRTRTRSTRYHGSHGKEDHVQATGQFLVLASAQLEMVPFYSEPNLAVPWKYIEALTLTSADCPICMSPPVAPKAGRCGHAHCYSCLLHLLAIADKKSAQCPICHCGIKHEDMRSVIVREESTPKSGLVVDFVKMSCPKGQVNPTVMGEQEEHWLDRHQRLIPIQRDTLIDNLLDREEAELAVQLVDAEESELPFIEQAQEELKQRRESLLTHPEYVSIAPPPPSDERHFFYQCAKGGVVFISSLNAKCLMEEYGSIEAAPDKLSGTVLEIEEFTMDAEIRRRFRYLAHLSDGQPFFVVHLDAKNLGLSEQTFLKYKDQILARQKRRQQKDKEESKGMKRFEEYYDRELYGKYQPADISLADLDMFPSFDESDGLPEVNSSPPSVTKESPTWAGRPKNQAIFTEDDFFPSLGGDANNNQQNGASGSFWGQMKSTTTPRQPLEPSVMNDFEEPDYAPRNNTNIGDDIAAALRQAKVSNESTTGARGKKGQKKKKGTKLAF